MKRQEAAWTMPNEYPVIGGVECGGGAMGTKEGGRNAMRGTQTSFGLACAVVVALTASGAGRADDAQPRVWIELISPQSDDQGYVHFRSDLRTAGQVEGIVAAESEIVQVSVNGRAVRLLPETLLPLGAPDIAGAKRFRAHTIIGPELPIHVVVTTADGGEHVVGFTCNADAARERLRDLMDTDPTDPMAVLRMARVTEREESLSLCHRAIALSPTLSDAYSVLGFRVLGAHGVEEARAAFEQAVALDPDNATALWGWGNALLRAGEDEQARMRYLTALEVDPGMVWAIEGMVCLMYGLREPDVCRQWCEQGLTIGSDSTVCRAYLGHLLQDEGNLTGAIEQYERALRINPDDVVCRLWIANALAAADEAEAAEQHYREGLRVRPEFTTMRLGLGKVLAQQGKYDAAEAEFRELVDEEVYAVEAYRGLARVYMATVRYDDARAAANSALDIVPGDPDTWAILWEIEQAEKAGQRE